MKIPFTKMHGLGNDFMLVRADSLPVPSPTRIARLADRRHGVGFDQLLWLEPARHPDDAVYYRIFNADGSEAEQCGNGARCIARLVAEPGQDEVRLGHSTGSVLARLHPDGSVSVRMAVPEFQPDRVPFVAGAAALRYGVTVAEQTIELGVVSMGNPHAVMRVADTDKAPVQQLGPLLERHERFPNRANIGFMQVVAPNHIRLRVFERGAGETTACGTGACAAVVIGQSWGLLENRVSVDLPGGTLQIQWDGPDHPVWMTGEAVTAFEGSVQL